MRKSSAAILAGCLGLLALVQSSAPWSEQSLFLPGFDPALIWHIRAKTDAERLRMELIQTIWQQRSLPSSIPDQVGGMPPLRFESNNIADAVVLTRRMEFGIESRSYYYRANRFSGCLFIYHSGHNEGVSTDLKASLWKRIVDQGCDLLYVAMPLMDQNPRPVVQSPFGPLLLNNHDILSLLQSDAFNPIKIFLEPILSSLNYLDSLRNYHFVFMAGLSGGGWTTTLYAALDERISGSYPVAGSLPESIKSLSELNLGDWEQFAANIYKLVNYLDLYLLGTYPGRVQIQLLNVFDPCCFSGRGAQSYSRQVAAASRQWAGSFEVSFDEQTKNHEVSAQHIETILKSVSTIAGLEFPPLSRPADICGSSNSKLPLKGPFRHERGYAYQASLPDLQNVADDVSHPYRSTLVVCEEKKSLGPNHTLHATIRQSGLGTFSHWTGYILFSTSDNTDPNQNGRDYGVISKQ